MKLKYLVAALGLATSASSFAAIGLPSSGPSVSELFLVVWTQGVAGHADSSFTFDTGVTMASFQAAAGQSQTWATLGTSNTEFTSFLGTTATSSFQYAVIAASSVKPATVLSTVTAGEEGTVAGFNNGQIGGAVTQVTTYLQSVNATGTHATQANGQSVNLIGSNAYFQDFGTANFNASLFGNSNAVGTSAEFTSLSKVTGPADTLGAETVQAGRVLFSKVGNDYVLNYTVAAVPEPSGYALMLAGLGLMGFVAARRRNNG